MSPTSPTSAKNGGRVRPIDVALPAQSARVYRGGRGRPLLLIHGGWGGASLHWGAVWERLAERFEVIAPDLPGVGRFDQKGLGSLDAYSRWLAALLDALEVPRVWCVGNSFGASVACRFAADYPDRCRGLVLVNGIAMPPTPRLLERLGDRRFGKRVIKAIQKRIAYSPASLRRAFFDPANIPEELRALVAQPEPPQLEAFADILVHGGGRGMPKMAPLLLWGKEDRLAGTGVARVRKIQASWPGAAVSLVERAGHMPQLENPAAFVNALASFVDSDERVRAASVAPANGP